MNMFIFLLLMAALFGVPIALLWGLSFLIEVCKDTKFIVHLAIEQRRYGVAVLQVLGSAMFMLGLIAILPSLFLGSWIIVGCALLSVVVGVFIGYHAGGRLADSHCPQEPLPFTDKWAKLNPEK
jgi:hypothetical protein